MEKPIEPKFENFSLSQERCLKLKQPYPDWLMGAVLWLGFLTVFLVVFLIAIKNSSVARTLTLSLSSALLGGLLFGCLLMIPVLGVSYVWKIRQHDFKAYKSYETAKAKYNQDLVTWTKLQLSWWQSLDGRGFETELSALFNKKGFVVIRTGKAGDQGIDLIIRNTDKIIIVQCKAHAKLIGPGPVRDLYGTLLHNQDKASEAWLVSTYGFSKQAKNFADGKPIKLITIHSLI